MLETQQTSPADPLNGGTQGDATVSPSSDVSSVSTDAVSQVDPVLQTLGTLTGRQYRDIEEAKSHLTNLNKLVGDNAIAEYRKKAKLADDVITRIAKEQGMSPQEAESYVYSLMNNPIPMQDTTTQETSPARLDPSIEERLRAGERAEFLLDNPDARNVIEKVQKYAHATGQRLGDAYTELYGEVKKSETEAKESEKLREEKKRASVTASPSTPPAQSTPEYKQHMSAYKRTRQPSALRSAIKGKFFDRGGE